MSTDIDTVIPDEMWAQTDATVEVLLPHIRCVVDGLMGNLEGTVTDRVRKTRFLVDEALTRALLARIQDELVRT